MFKFIITVAMLAVAEPETVPETVVTKQQSIIIISLLYTTNITVKYSSNYFIIIYMTVTAIEYLELDLAMKLNAHLLRADFVEIPHFGH